MSSTAISTDRRTAGLRVAGFLVTVAAVVLVAVGCLLEWIEVGLRGISADVISPTFVGIDITEGKIVLGLALVAIVTVLIARVGRRASRRWAAVVVALAGIGVLVATVSLALTATDRYARLVAEELSGPSKQVDPDLVAGIADLIQVRLRSGLWLSMAGGVGIVLGGLMTLAWARRRAAVDAAPTVP